MCSSNRANVFVLFICTSVIWCLDIRELEQVWFMELIGHHCSSDQTTDQGNSLEFSSKNVFVYTCICNKSMGPGCFYVCLEIGPPPILLSLNFPNYLFPASAPSFFLRLLSTNGWLCPRQNHVGVWKEYFPSEEKIYFISKDNCCSAHLKIFFSWPVGTCVTAFLEIL